MATKSLQSKLVARLSRGPLTVNQIRAIGFANPYDAIYKIRQSGSRVVSMEKRVRGSFTTVYSLG